MSNLRCCFLIFFSVSISQPNPLSAQEARVRVEIHDFAGLSSATLVEFANRTESILTKAGVPAHVDICRGNGAQTCDGDRNSTRRYLIRVLSGQAKQRKNARRPPLGQSFINQEGGRYASVFVESVRDVSAEASVPWVLVLSYVAAHEVGHLLSGNEDHAPSGLMKATWGQKDLQAMAQEHLSCTLLPAKREAAQAREAKGSQQMSETRSSATECARRISSAAACGDLIGTAAEK
jgi:hypothetical protein